MRWLGDEERSLAWNTLISGWESCRKFHSLTALIAREHQIRKFPINFGDGIFFNEFNAMYAGARGYHIH